MKPTLATAMTICTVFACGGLSAQELSVTTTTGTLFGSAYEYVYDQSVATNYKVSELDWGFAPIYYYGVDLNLVTQRGFTLMVSAKSGISALSGTMQDSDFLNGDGAKTLYSRSDNYTEQALLARLELGYRLPNPSGLTVSPLLSVDYLQMKWAARDGYLQYPPSTGQTYSVNSNGTVNYGTRPVWDASLPETPIYGVSVIYGQQFLIPSVGLRASFTSGKRLDFLVSCLFSPIIIGRASDDHVLRSLSTVDTFTHGIFFEPSLLFEYAMTERVRLRLGATYKLITDLVGATTWQSDGTTSTSPSSPYYAGPGSGSTVTNGAGAGFEALDVSLSFRVSL